MALTPEYRQAKVIQEVVGQLAKGLAELVLIKEAEAQEILPEIEEAEELDSLEPYVEPDERKRQSVRRWVNNLSNRYQIDYDEASAITKSSAREAARERALKRFVRSFEKYGDKDDEEHIIFDCDSLETVLDELGSGYQRDRDLKEVVLSKTCEFAADNALKIISDPVNLANFFRASTRKDEVGQNFDAILGSLFKYAGIRYPATAAEYHLADAAMELIQEDTVLNKALDSITRGGDFIGNIDEYVKSYGQELVTALRLDDVEAQARMLQANAVVEQIKTQLQKQPFQSVRLGESDTSIYKDKATTDLAEFKFALKRVLSFDPVEVIDISSGQIHESDRLPCRPDLYDAMVGSHLFKKRMQTVAPKAYGQKAGEEILLRDPETDHKDGAYTFVANAIIGPDIGLSLTLSRDTGPSKEETQNFALTDEEAELLSKVMDDLSYRYYNSGHIKKPINKKGGLTMYSHKYFVKGKADRLAVVAVLRPSIVSEKKGINPANQLFLSLRGLLTEGVLDDVDPNEYDALLNKQKQELEETHHQYPGRRPIRFTLPVEWQKFGLKSVKIRQPEDYRRTVAEVQHEAGVIKIELDENLSIIPPKREIPTSHKPEFSFAIWETEMLIVKLIKEWSCRPEIETSEGTVSVREEQGNRLNFGHFARLPIVGGKKHKHTPEQARIYRRERGRDLAQESLKRQPRDPKGLARNSTYVREASDPDAPPLDIYYDQSILKQ